MGEIVERYKRYGLYYNTYQKVLYIYKEMPVKKFVEMRLEISKLRNRPKNIIVEVR